MSGTDRAPLELGGTHYAGRYELQALIGTGGMSAVYRARDTALGRDVAIKVLTDGLADAAAIARRQGEVNLLASFAHPSLVTLYDYVTPDDQPSGLVMQLVKGRDLHERLRSGSIESSAVASIGRQIAEALAYLGAENVVHRDVKPGNILVEEHDDGRVRALLADFGIARMVDAARHTTVGTVIGTARYLSPEQASGGSVGPATDVYSLGLVLLEALTGAPAYPGSQVETVAARLTRDPQIPESVGGEWRALLRGMTRREAALRLSAADAAARLRVLESGAATAAVPVPLFDDEATVAIELPVTAVAPTATARPALAPRPAGWITAAAAAAMVLIAGVIAVPALTSPAPASAEATMRGMDLVERPAAPVEQAPPPAPEPAPAPVLVSDDGGNGGGEEKPVKPEKPEKPDKGPGKDR